MRIGILTGGGDCPGLNAVIRAATRRGMRDGHKMIGIRKGWKGLLTGEHIKLGRDETSGILDRGGTILKSSRTNPLKEKNGLKKVKATMKKLKIDALIAIGGDDTLGVAKKLHDAGIKVVGVPKTIDRDLSATDTTIGFDTAVNIVTEAIDRLHTTAESHNRTIIMEVMGRHSGWIAVMAGIAGGADVVLLPEKPFKIDDVCGLLIKRLKRGRDFSIVVVAEGAALHKTEKLITQSDERDAFGNVRLGGIGEVIGREIKKRIGFDTRVVNLGHVQRGGTPTAFDRILGSRLGVKAVELINQKKYGTMVSLKGDKLVPVKLSAAVGKRRFVDDDLYKVAELFFG